MLSNLKDRGVHLKKQDFIFLIVIIFLLCIYCLTVIDIGSNKYAEASDGIVLIEQNYFDDYGLRST